MKTTQFITSVFSILIMFCFALMFTGCNNDDDNGSIDDPATVIYRVAERVSTDIYNSNIDEDKSVYNYLDNRLIDVIDYEKDNDIWMEDRKTEFEYDGDWVSSRRYYKEGESWIPQDFMSTQEMKIVDGKVMEIKETYMNYEYRQVFTYSGDKIIKLEFFDNGELEEKYVCTYIGENLDEIIEYEYDNGIEELDSKYEFSYVNGNLTEVLRFYYDNGVWENSDRDVYIYSGNKVIQIDDYDYNSFSESWELDDSEYYSYNSQGLLESISESGDGWSWEEIYTYEEGIGNYKLLMGEGGFYEVFNYPTAQRVGDSSVNNENSKINIERFLMQ